MHYRSQRVTAVLLASLASAAAFVPSGLRMQSRARGYVMRLLIDPSLDRTSPLGHSNPLYSSSARLKNLTPIRLEHSRMSMDASGLVGADRETGGVFDPLGLANNKDDETLGWCVRLFDGLIIVHARFTPKS